MDLYEVVDQVSALLQQRGRLTYRMLKRQFGLDDETLADLKDELIKAAQVARDENGEVLVWAGLYYLLLVDSYRRLGRPEEGLAVLADLLAEEREEHINDAEICRLKGELLLMQAEKLRRE